MDETISEDEKQRRLRFVEAANEEYAALRRDASAWEEEMKERELWAQTLADGVDD